MVKIHFPEIRGALLEANMVDKILNEVTHLEKGEFDKARDLCLVG